MTADRIQRMFTSALFRFVRRSVLAAAMMLVPVFAGAQVVACDFDIADDEGVNMWGSTIHLTGRPGASTEIGQFVIINANSAAMDVDHDGYALACDYTALYVPEQLKFNLINVTDPALAIPAQNVIIQNLSASLPSGQMARVRVSVELPAGTIAGTYRGTFQVRDNIQFVTITPTNEILNMDVVQVEVVVVDQPALTLVDPDSAAELDSVVIRGRAGTRATGVLRIANTGNARLADIQFSASDLRSESAVGLVIPSGNISFTVPSLASLGVADTARVTVTVAIPRGILGGRYRGTITAQSGDADSRTIPLIVIVTSTRGILFANNPARDVAQIAFNGDPGTNYRLGIFDMTGRMVWETGGTVFAGTGGTPAAPTAGADFAQSVTWSLVNMRGEAVASGMYLVVVESFVSGQRTATKDRLMVIR